MTQAPVTVLQDTQLRRIRVSPFDISSIYLKECGHFAFLRQGGWCVMGDALARARETAGAQGRLAAVSP